MNAQELANAASDVIDVATMSAPKGVDSVRVVAMALAHMCARLNVGDAREDVSLYRWSCLGRAMADVHESFTKLVDMP